LFVLFLALVGEVWAVGLGDLRGQAVLGERSRFEIDLIGGSKELLDPACFQLGRPADGEVPWLRQASFKVRKGNPFVLEIIPSTPLRDPILQFAVQINCGHEVVREYMVFASPASEKVVEAPKSIVAPVVPRGFVERRTNVQDAVASRPRAQPQERRAPRQRQPAPAPVEFPRAVEPADRLVLSGGGDVEDPSLRLSSELSGNPAEGIDAQRNLLRLEFKLLTAMQEQASSQMSASERLRAMEETIGELRRQSGEVVQDMEKQSVTPAATENVPSALPKVVGENPPVDPAASSSLSEWGLYGILLGILLGLGGWLGWRNYQDRQAKRVGGSFEVLVPEVEAIGQNSGDFSSDVDLPVEPVIAGSQVHVDFDLDVGDESPVEPVASTPASSRQVFDNSPHSIAATTVDEHFEANPVMELADIMLSFGRVKGAAQALQEFIDNNPQEALQPWIRLLEVYRMAGMRDEFDTLARNLNQNFNVEVLQWDDRAIAAAPSAAVDFVLDQTSVEAGAAENQARAGSIEEMPRISDQLVRLWSGSDARDYLEQLLRDNRGGKRAGFSMPVVGEILFLIELKDTIAKMEKEEELHE
jgi:hypothetical protein